MIMSDVIYPSGSFEELESIFCIANSRYETKSNWMQTRRAQSIELVEFSLATKVDRLKQEQGQHSGESTTK